MKVEKLEYYTEAITRDEDGEVSLQIQNDCSQIRIKKEWEDSYLDIDKKDLIIIRDMINGLLGGD